MLSKLSLFRKIVFGVLLVLMLALVSPVLGQDRAEIDLATLLTEIEAGLRTQPSEEFRAYGLARLGRLYYTRDRVRAKELWKEAFRLS